MAADPQAVATALSRTLPVGTVEVLGLGTKRHTNAIGLLIRSRTCGRGCGPNWRDGSDLGNFVGDNGNDDQPSALRPEPPGLTCARRRGVVELNVRHSR